VSNSIRIIKTSDQFMAAWVYFSTPVKYPGQVLSGALKALFTKFFLPAFLLMYGVAFYIWSLAITDDFIFGLFNNLVMFVLMEKFADHYLPFSRQQNIKEQSGRFVKVLVQFAVIAALVGLHYLALKINYLVLGLVPVAAFGAYLLFKNIQSLRWKDMKI
jgi:ABC-2 type transport system permease protein